MNDAKTEVKEYEIYKVTLLAKNIEYPFSLDFSEYKTIQHIGKYKGVTPQAAINAMAKDENYMGYKDDEYFFAKPSRYIRVNKRIQQPDGLRFANKSNKKIYRPEKNS